jgi:ribosomal protein S18 acetylase RimI-like enzyme
MSATPPYRRARAEDADAIAALVNRAYAKYVPRIGRKPMPMLADYPDSIRRHQVWVVEADGAIVAALVLIPEADTLLIENIAVDPTHQGGGFGRQLMAFAVSEAQRQGYASIRLYTNEKMTENITIYGHLGYRETGRETLRGLHVVHMRKELGGDA